MAETCIVCLGDLAHPDEGSSATELEPATKSLVDGADVNLDNPATSTSIASEQQKDDEMVAHLLPCGHNLHNECLKPWVERANSCPICRASFNMVELSARVGGMSIYDKKKWQAMKSGGYPAVNWLLAKWSVELGSTLAQSSTAAVLCSNVKMTEGMLLTMLQVLSSQSLLLKTSNKSPISTLP